MQWLWVFQCKLSWNVLFEVTALQKGKEGYLCMPVVPQQLKIENCLQKYIPSIYFCLTVSEHGCHEWCIPTDDCEPAIQEILSKTSPVRTRGRLVALCIQVCHRGSHQTILMGENQTTQVCQKVHLMPKMLWCMYYVKNISSHATLKDCLLS